MAMTACLSLYCFLVFGPPALALDPGAAPPGPVVPASIQGFGRANASCQSWSDGCSVCSRRDGDAAACSTPGIACTPGPIACRTP